MARRPTRALLSALENLLGPRGFTRDPTEMEPWLTDWRGRYRGQADAMLSPSSTRETQAIVSHCAQAGVPLVPQGGNTSMVGGATPPADASALLLSMRRMDAIRTASPADNAIVAEAGVILTQVHEAANAIGLRFPLSLAAKGTATIGGLVSTNAGGTQVLRFGPMRSLILGLEAVLPDGSLFEGLSALRKDNRGYDVKQLLVGAEGTLGVVTAASLRLVGIPGSTAVAWVGLASPAAALSLLRALDAWLGEAVESFEIVPENALQLVLEKIPGTRQPLTGAHRWHVLIEAVAPHGARGAREALEEALGEALETRLVEDAVVAANGAQMAALWRLRETIAEAERTQGPAVKHDISVPVSAMPEFLEAAAGAIRSRFAGARIIAFGHLGDGNVHFNVQAPGDADGAAWLDRHSAAVTESVHDLVGAYGGSISAEHGIGQMKLSELARTGGAARLWVMRAVKRALDPSGIMNPGKLLPQEQA